MSEDIKFKLITYVDTDFEAKTQTYEYFIELEDGVERSLKDILIENVKLKEQQDTISRLEKENEQLKQKVNFYKYFQKDARELEKENEKLRKQIQNYEKLLSNSYVGEEETLDGFVGKYEIWEDELQKYRKKE